MPFNFAAMICCLFTNGNYVNNFQCSRVFYYLYFLYNSIYNGNACIFIFIDFVSKGFLFTVLRKSSCESMLRCCAVRLSKTMVRRNKNQQTLSSPGTCERRTAARLGIHDTGTVSWRAGTWPRCTSYRSLLMAINRHAGNLER